MRTRLSMETRRALATMRHLIRQASSHVLRRICGAEAHQDRPTASVKDKVELGNVQDRRGSTVFPSKAARLTPLLHIACTSLATAIGSHRTPRHSRAARDTYASTSTPKQRTYVFHSRHRSYRAPSGNRLFEQHPVRLPAGTSLSLTKLVDICFSAIVEA